MPPVSPDRISLPDRETPPKGQEPQAQFNTATPDGFVAMYRGLPYELPLGVDGGGDCGGRRGERREHSVARRLEYAPAADLDGAAQDLVVARQRGGHRVALALPESRAAFDVGEQEGHGAGW